MDADTIAAIATPPGRGAIAVIRVSGPDVPKIATHLIGRCPLPRTATYTPVEHEGERLDEAVVTFFEGPRSATGEHVLELCVHGGPAVSRAVLDAVLAAGARPARPGEFTERAYLNGRLDLVQAEAVADLVNASTARAARSAMRALSGRFSQALADLETALLAARVRVEAMLDFPEDDLPEYVRAHEAALADLERELARVLAGARRGHRVSEGVRIAIVGPPNVGKSSLLNALVGDDRAIVTDVPGTTRDPVLAAFELDGMPVSVVDTAGLRETDDVVESIGIARTLDAVRSVDAIIALTATDVPPDPAAFDRIAGITGPDTCVVNVHNKRDLDPAGTRRPEGAVAISARTGEGLDDLRATLARAVGSMVGPEDEFSARTRHLDALGCVEAAIARARPLSPIDDGELIAEELAAAHDALGTITGRVTRDDVLGAIFSSFCIGK